VLVTSVRSGRVFRVAQGQQHDQQTNGDGVAYARGDQVWYRSFHLDAAGRHLRRGREQLVSDTPRGRGGNGSSSHPSLDDEGRYVAFQSNATDLCGRRRCRGIEKDWNGPLPDVYRRTLSRRAPTHDSMEQVNASFGVHVYGVPAVAPVISNGGENVMFIVPGSSIWYMNPGYQSVRIPSGDVATWSFPRGRGFGKFRVMHRAGCYPSRCVTQAAEVTMSARGNYIAYASTMPEFCAPRRPRGWPGDRDCPGFTDIFVRFMGWSHEGKPLG
jgi:hypothetical protein